MSEIKAQFYEAQRIHQAGKVLEAAEIYKRILDASPNHFLALTFLGLALHQQGLSDQGVALIEKAVKIYPNYVSMINAGKVFLDMGQFAKAVHYCDDAIRLHRDHTAHNIRGVALKNLKRFDEAVKSFNEVIALAPDYVDAFNNLGNVFLELLRFDEALANYDKAISLDPHYPEAVIGRARALFRIGRINDAKAAYDRAIKLKPGMAAELFYERAESLRAKNLLDSAIADYQKALDLKPEFADALYRLASLGKADAPSAAPETYVRAHFDEFAETYDGQLLQALEYQTPFILAKQFERYCERPSLEVLDLGCGTGLSGSTFRPFARRLSGVDISGKMLRKASERSFYDELVCAEIGDYLRKTKHRFDLILCVEVLVYLGDLRGIFEGISECLARGGYFSFSVEEGCAQKDFCLKETGRYGHSIEYIERLAEYADLELREVQRCDLRKERGRFLPGYAILARKA